MNTYLRLIFLLCAIICTNIFGQDTDRGADPFDWNDWHPSWSPDSTKIAVNSYRDGNYEIYLINADGSGLANVTRHPGYNARRLLSCNDGGKNPLKRYKAKN